MTRVSNEALRELMLEKFDNLNEKIENLNNKLSKLEEKSLINDEKTERLYRKVITGNGEKSLLQRISSLEKGGVLLIICVIMLTAVCFNESILPLFIKTLGL